MSNPTTHDYLTDAQGWLEVANREERALAVAAVGILQQLTRIADLFNEASDLDKEDRARTCTRLAELTEFAESSGLTGRDSERD
jgi:hypothetical protein